jgi:hypothetical protein
LDDVWRERKRDKSMTREKERRDREKKENSQRKREKRGREKKDKLKGRKPGVFF